MTHSKNCNSCRNLLLSVHDALNVLSGKWKLAIIGALMFDIKKFRELEREIMHITPRMLSKELKELELNGIVKRTVRDTKPVSVEYSLTESGQTLKKVVETMAEWGQEHRGRIMKKEA
jgi:DNA-binding HxlR family transcriptional regulator